MYRCRKCTTVQNVCGYGWSVADTPLTRQAVCHAVKLHWQEGCTAFAPMAVTCKPVSCLSLYGVSTVRRSLEDTTLLDSADRSSQKRLTPNHRYRMRTLGVTFKREWPQRMANIYQAECVRDACKYGNTGATLHIRGRCTASATHVCPHDGNPSTVCQSHPGQHRDVKPTNPKPRSSTPHALRSTVLPLLLLLPPLQAPAAHVSPPGWVRGPAQANSAASLIPPPTHMATPCHSAM